MVNNSSGVFGTALKWGLFLLVLSYNPSLDAGILMILSQLTGFMAPFLRVYWQVNKPNMHHYTLQTRFVTRQSKGNNLLNILTGLYNKIAYVHGCHLYIINQDAENGDHILVTELWDSPESHEKSQTLRDFQEALSQASPLLAVEPERKVLKAVAGKGLL